MKSIVIPKYPAKIPFAIPKEIIKLLPDKVVKRGQRNFLQVFRSSGALQESRRSRYKNLDGIQSDFVSLCIEAEKAFGPVKFICEKFREIDPGSLLFLQLAQVLFGWEIEFKENLPQASLNELEKNLVRVLDFGIPIDFDSSFKAAEDYSRVGDLWTCQLLLEKIIADHKGDAAKVDTTLYLLMDCAYRVLNLEKATLISQRLILSNLEPIKKASVHYIRAMLATRKLRVKLDHDINAANELKTAIELCELISDRNADYFAQKSVIYNGLSLLEYVHGSQDQAMKMMKASEDCIEQIKDLRFEDYQAMHPVMLSNQARIHAAAGEFDLAVSKQKEALDLEPDYLENHINLIRLYRDNDQLEEARDVLHAALELVPGEPLLYQFLAELNDQPDINYRRAIQYSAFSALDNEEYIYNYCVWLHENENFAEVEKFLEQLIHLQPLASAAESARFRGNMVVSSSLS